jgi:hypothetical protein
MLIYENESTLPKPPHWEVKREGVRSAVTELRTHSGIHRIKLAVTLVSMSYLFHDSGLWGIWIRLQNHTKRPVGSRRGQNSHIKVYF